jgi:hypothetical protein
VSVALDIQHTNRVRRINPLNAELKPICHLLSLLAHLIFHVSRIRVKANLHTACRAHAVPLPCHALIHICHAVPLPCSDSAVSFVKVRVVAGNIQTTDRLFCSVLLPLFTGVGMDRCEEDLYASDNNLRGTPCGSRKKPNVGSPQAVSRRLCCAVALRRTAWSEHGMGAAWQV